MIADIFSSLIVDISTDGQENTGNPDRRCCFGALDPCLRYRQAGISPKTRLMVFILAIRGNGVSGTRRGVGCGIDAQRCLAFPLCSAGIPILFHI